MDILASYITILILLHLTKAASGFSAVGEQLMNAANITSCSDYQNNVIVLMDEMHIKKI